MKKLFPGILAMVMCFGMLAACGDDNKPSSSPDSSPADSSSSSSVTPMDPHEATLNDVKSYVHEQLIKKNYETRKDFTLMNSFSFIGEDVKYDISWSVDVEEGVTIVEGETEDTVVIGELSEDLPFILTGTITDPEGCHSVQFTLEGLALKALSEVPTAITEAPVEGEAYKYHVYQSTLAKDMYFAGDMSGYYFLTTEVSTEAVDVFVEYKAGSTTEFYPWFNHAENGKQYIGVRLSDDGAHDNIVYASEPVSVFVWNAELGTITTHLDKNKNGEAADYYLGNYSTHKTISASMLSYAGGAGNNVGHLVKMVDKNSITPDKKVAEEKEKLSVVSEVIGEKSIELIAKGNTYSDVAIAWEVSGNNAVIENGVLKLSVPATADETVTLTATITCGDVTDTKVFSILLKKYELPAADSEISIPKALEIGETLKDKTEAKYYISGTVTSVENTKYGNLYIEDANGNSIYVYGVYSADGTTRYDAMENAPQVGDTVKLYSIVSYYNAAQLNNAWVVEWTPGEEQPPVDSSSSNTDVPPADDSSSSNTDVPPVDDSSSSTDAPSAVVSVSLNAASFGIASDKYTYDEVSATIGGTTFSAIQVGNYPDGLLRFRTKEGVHGSIWNTTAFSGKITKLVFTLNPAKSGYADNAYVLKLGNTAACDEKTVDLKTTADSVWTIEITGTYTYFKIEHNNTYTQYWDSLEIFYVSNGEVPPADDSSSSNTDVPPADDSSSSNTDVPPADDSSSSNTDVPPVDDSSSSTDAPSAVVSVSLNAASFGIASDKYTSEEISATVGGTTFSAIQVGNYSDGLLRFRTHKDTGVHGSIWNTTAFSGKITKLVFTLNPAKSGYADNAYVLKLGNTAACDEKTVDLKTTADSVWTIEITGTYTYFKIEHNNTYTQYWDSLEIFYVSNGEVPPADDSSSSNTDVPPADDSSSSNTDVPPADDSSSNTDVPPADTLTAVVPNVDTPYIFGMTQGNCGNAVYYLAGGMDGYYMATTTNADDAIQTYIEATEGGYYFYTYVNNVKTYINMVVSGTHVNGAYETTASTVYTIDEAHHTLIAVVNGEQYWFATRNDKTYTTMGPCKVSYNGFYAEFYA